MQEYIEHNRRAWNEIAAIRQKALFPPAEFFASGQSILDPVVVTLAGDIQGVRLLHLQCATGEEVLSWANLGAQATGVDLSDKQIALAKKKAKAAGIKAEFVAADLYTLPESLQAGSFDLVYVSEGAIPWLPDLDGWAQAIVRALRPGGRLLLIEEHPIAGCLWVTDGKLQIDYDYFARNTPDMSTTWGHFPGGEFANETKVEFQWPLGDVLTALAQAGLRLLRLEERPSTAAWRFGEALDEVQRIPGQYVLLAQRDMA